MSTHRAPRTADHADHQALPKQAALQADSPAPRPATLQRRDFIRLLGGGTLAAAGASVGLTGCSAALPDAAISAWRGPAEDASLQQWAVAWAILAPSSHNLQPWLVDLREPDAIVLRVDRQRLLPETDPWFRQIMVSQGSFLEALVLALAARGLAADVALFPEGAFDARTVDDRPVARVTWRAAAGPDALSDPLFHQLPLRRTSRVPFDAARPVPASALSPLLAAAATVPGVDAGGTVDAAEVQALRQLCAEATRVEFGTPHTMLESLRLMRVGPAEIERHRDGISLNQPRLRLFDALGLFDRTRPAAPGTPAFERSVAAYEAQVLSAQGFVWLSTTSASAQALGSTRHAEVQAGRAQLRLHLQATRDGLRLQPLSQPLQEFAEMAPWYRRVHEQVLGSAASGSTVQMLCRVGHAADTPPAPRRGLQAVLQA